MTKQFFILMTAVSLGQAAPGAAAISAFNSYAAQLEARLAAQHRRADGFRAAAGPDAQLPRGEAVIEQIRPAASGDTDGATIHDWRGTAFVPGAHAADFERVLRDFNGYPEYFAPDVVEASVLSASDDNVSVHMRVRQRHVLTVVMDLTCDVIFGRLDALRRYSISRSSRITELGDEDHGFLWRLNTYWTYEESDGGVYLQIETVSLSRSVPKGLGWLITPYVESIPRDSIEFTLRSALRALLDRKG